MAGGSDLLHLKRLTWDAIEAQTPPTAARLAEELAIPVKSVCAWLDGESKPDDRQVLALIKMARGNEQRRQPDAAAADDGLRKTPLSNVSGDDRNRAQ